MNTYKKYCPNVWLARCSEPHEAGEVIIVTSKRGKENRHIIHNFIAAKETKEGETVYFYSITREDGFDSKEYAKNKAAKLEGYANSAERRANEWQEKSNEGRGFLSLGEPIKVGHHSEGRHRRLIERNHRRMDKAMEEKEKAQSYEARIQYWEAQAKKINLSSPESMEFYRLQLEEAIEYHQGLKDGTIAREHSFSLTYAKKRVNELTNKLEIALLLWS